MPMNYQRDVNQSSPIELSWWIVSLVLQSYHPEQFCVTIPRSRQSPLTELLLRQFDAVFPPTWQLDKDVVNEPSRNSVIFEFSEHSSSNTTQSSDVIVSLIRRKSSLMTVVVLIPTVSNVKRRKVETLGAISITPRKCRHWVVDGILNMSETKAMLSKEQSRMPLGLLFLLIRLLDYDCSSNEVILKFLSSQQRKLCRLWQSETETVRKSLVKELRLIGCHQVINQLKEINSDSGEIPFNMKAPLPKLYRKQWIDQQVSFSSSKFWSHSVDTYKELKLEAWTSDSVPHRISSNALLVHQYFECIMSFVHSRPKLQKTYIVELGAGHGYFGYQLARLAWITRTQGCRCDDGSPDVSCTSCTLKQRTFCVVLTDFHIGSLDMQFSTSNEFMELAKSGLLDYAKLDLTEWADATDVLQVQLEYSGKDLALTAQQSDLVFVANYLLDSLPHDIFRLRHTNPTTKEQEPASNLGLNVDVFKGLVSTHSVTGTRSSLDEQKRKRVEIDHRNVTVEFEHVSHEDIFRGYPMLQQIFDTVCSLILKRAAKPEKEVDIPFMFPTVAVKALMNLMKYWTSEDTGTTKQVLILVGDKVYDCFNSSHWMDSKLPNEMVGETNVKFVIPGLDKHGELGMFGTSCTWIAPEQHDVSFAVNLYSIPNSNTSSNAVAFNNFQSAELCFWNHTSRFGVSEHERLTGWMFRSVIQSVSRRFAYGLIFLSECDLEVFLDLCWKIESGPPCSTSFHVSNADAVVNAAECHSARCEFEHVQLEHLLHQSAVQCSLKRFGMSTSEWQNAKLNVARWLLVRKCYEGALIVFGTDEDAARAVQNWKSCSELDLPQQIVGEVTDRVAVVLLSSLLRIRFGTRALKLRGLWDNIKSTMLGEMQPVEKWSSRIQRLVEKVEKRYCNLAVEASD